MRNPRLREVRHLAHEYTASQEEILAWWARDLSSLLTLYMRSTTGQERCQTAGPSRRIALKFLCHSQAQVKAWLLHLGFSPALLL